MDADKIRKQIAFTTVSSLIIFSLYCLICFFIYPTNPKYEDCGKVVSKSADEITIKHGTRTDLYLNIQFEKTGFQSINCSPTCYFSTKVGETVCFDLNKDISIWYMIREMWGGLCLIVTVIGAIVLFVMYLLGEIPEKKTK